MIYNGTDMILSKAEVSGAFPIISDWLNVLVFILLFLGIFLGFLFAILYYSYKQKRKLMLEYEATLDDKQYRKRKEFKDRLDEV